LKYDLETRCSVNGLKSNLRTFATEHGDTLTDQRKRNAGNQT